MITFVTCSLTPASNDDNKINDLLWVLEDHDWPPADVQYPIEQTRAFVSALSDCLDKYSYGAGEEFLVLLDVGLALDGAFAHVVEHRLHPWFRHFCITSKYRYHACNKSVLSKIPELGRTARVPRGPIPLDGVAVSLLSQALDCLLHGRVLGPMFDWRVKVGMNIKNIWNHHPDHLDTLFDFLHLTSNSFTYISMRKLEVLFGLRRAPQNHQFSIAINPRKIRTTQNPCIWEVLPWKLTWNLKITPSKRKIIFQTSVFGFHVNFPGCNSSSKLNWW